MDDVSETTRPGVDETTRLGADESGMEMETVVAMDIEMDTDVDVTLAIENDNEDSEFQELASSEAAPQVSQLLAVQPSTTPVTSEATPQDSQLPTPQPSSSPVTPTEECNPCRKTDCAAHPPVQCLLCTSNFPTSLDLMLHIQSQHKNQRGFFCDEEGCDKAYKTVTAWREHIRGYHRVDTRCEICALVFRNKADLRAHKEGFHGGKSPFECTLCKFETMWSGNLLRHLRSRRHSEKINRIESEGN